MQALGFKVKTGPHYASRYGGLAGTDAERAGDINAMFADEGVKAVIFLRGGSGAARLLPLLDYDAIRATPRCCSATPTSPHCTAESMRRQGTSLSTGPTVRAAGTNSMRTSSGACSSDANRCSTATGSMPVTDW